MLAQLALQKETASNVAITEGDVRMFYQANAAQFVTPAQCTVAHIQLDSAAAASNLRHQAFGPADFAALARTHSRDAATAASGGVVKEPLLPGQGMAAIGFTPGMVDLVMQTSAGSVCGTPLQSDRGWHLVKVLTHTPARRLTFKEVQHEAHDRLRTQKESEVQDALMRRLRDKYDVVIHQGMKK